MTADRTGDEERSQSRQGLAHQQVSLRGDAASIRTDAGSVGHDSCSFAGPKMLALYRQKKDWMVETTHSQHAIRALDFLFAQPTFNASHFVNHAAIPAPTARRILKLCSDAGLLDVLEQASGRRPTVYRFPELLQITED